MGQHFLLGIFLTLVATASTAQVYRCGNTYSEEPCAGGKAIDTSPPVSDPRGPSTTLLYLCRNTQDSLAWIPEPCATRGWTLERMERVPRNLPWEEQVRAARAQRRQAQALHEPEPAVRYAPSAAPQADSRKASCQALDEQVKALDSMGRAGSRLYDLDRLRRERKAARDQQFRLRCP